MKLGCGILEKRQSKPDNLNQIIKIKYCKIKGCKNSNRVLYDQNLCQNLFYIPEIIRVELISRHHQDLLRQFEIKKFVN